jgi:hypothetical protein
MITVVTGNPGAGKTANVVKFDFFNAMVRGPWRTPEWSRTQVATNLTLRPGWAEAVAAGLPMRSSARRQQMAVDMKNRVLRFEDFALLSEIGLACDRCGAEDEECGHLRKEGRGLCIFDEASDPLDTRTWDLGSASKRESVLSRKAQIDFLKQHRKAGWHVVLIAQDLSMLDSHIRKMVDYERMMRNLSNWRSFGIPVGRIFGNLFTQVEAWESGPRKKNGMMLERMINSRRVYRLGRSTKRIYDTAGKSHALAAKPASIWLPRATLMQLESGASEAEPAALASAIRVLSPPDQPSQGSVTPGRNDKSDAAGMS